MLVMLLLVELCQKCIIGLIYFAHVVPVSAIILNLIGVFLLLMKVEECGCSYIFLEILGSGCDWP